MNNYPDAMISVSLDRQAEKVRQVQACGLGRQARYAPILDPMDAARRGRPSARQAATALAMALVVIGTLLLVFVAR